MVAPGGRSSNAPLGSIPFIATHLWKMYVPGASLIGGHPSSGVPSPGGGPRSAVERSASQAIHSGPHEPSLGVASSNEEAGEAPDPARHAHPQRRAGPFGGAGKNGSCKPGAMARCDHARSPLRRSGRAEFRLPGRGRSPEGVRDVGGWLLIQCFRLLIQCFRLLAGRKELGGGSSSDRWLCAPQPGRRVARSGKD